VFVALSITPEFIMTYFVSTAMGFITSNKLERRYPKQCINQAHSRDVRYAHPFNSWDEANRFATELTTSPNWPPNSRYYAIMTSASPNTQHVENHAAEAPRTSGLATRLRALLGSAAT
jgi:hypothetical protein